MQIPAGAKGVVAAKVNTLSFLISSNGRLFIHLLGDSVARCLLECRCFRATASPWLTSLLQRFRL